MVQFEYSVLTNRAIDIQALIGTIGGYVGLFLGYSMLQIPNAVIFLAKKIIRWYSDIKLQWRKDVSPLVLTPIPKILSHVAPFVENENYDRNKNSKEHVFQMPQGTISAILDNMIDAKIKAQIDDVLENYVTKSEMKQKMYGLLESGRYLESLDIRVQARYNDPKPMIEQRKSP